MRARKLLKNFGDPLGTAKRCWLLPPGESLADRREPPPASFQRAFAHPSALWIPEHDLSANPPHRLGEFSFSVTFLLRIYNSY